jgi:hypothetical protein
MKGVTKEVELFGTHSISVVIKENSMLIQKNNLVVAFYPKEKVIVCVKLDCFDWGNPV